jgi:pimeloyl-ACP methyl ester carboxylesterase
MVLLHGFPASLLMFRHLIPRLADRYHIRGFLNRTLP